MRYRLFRFVSGFFQHALRAVVRTVVIVVFGACVGGLLHYMGVPVPSAHQLFRSFEGLSKLGKIFS